MRGWVGAEQKNKTKHPPARQSGVRSANNSLARCPERGLAAWISAAAAMAVMVVVLVVVWVVRGLERRGTSERPGCN